MSAKQRSRSTRQAIPLSKSPRRAMLHAQVKLLKATNPQGELSRLRKTIPSGIYSTLIEWLISQPGLYKRYMPPAFPSTPDQLKSFPALNAISLNKELRWCYSSLSPHLSKINQFLSCRRQLDQAFLTSDDDQCMRLLNEMQHKFGFSLWLTKKNLAFLQETKGLDAQKSYLQMLMNYESKVPSIVLYIAYFISFRSETSVSPAHFMNLHENALLKIDLPSNLGSYLRYHITCTPVSSIDDIAGLLSIESLGSAIDFYEMLISSAQMIVAYDHQDFFPILLSILTKLALNLQDHRISRLMLLLTKGKRQGELFSSDDCGFTEFFNSQSKSKQIYCSPSVCAESDGQALLMCALSSSEESKKEDNNVNQARYLRTVQFLRSILTADVNREKAKANLIRLSWALEGSEYAALIRSILTAEGTTIRPSGLPTFRPLYLALGFRRFCPSELWWIVDPETRATMNATVANVYDMQVNSWMYFEMDSSSCPSCTFTEPLSPPALWRKTAQALRLRDYETALQTANLLKNEPHPFYRTQAMYAIVISLRGMGRIEDCINYLAENIVCKSELRNILPITETYSALTTEDKSKLVSNLGFVCLTDIYVDLTGATLVNLRSYVAEDFLAVHSMNRPSQLRDHIGDFDKKMLIHFLKTMCTEQVMDSWIEFSSSNDVAVERALVCQMLIELDSSHIEQYQAEIRDIMRKLTLRKRLREVEQSKIYVDIKGMKNAAKESLQEDFTRYMAFIKHGMTIEDRTVIDNARQQFARGDIEAVLAMAFPRNEMSTLFETMVIRFLNEFVSSNQHGLDGYLSVRIRHGTLAGQLRGPLESENLLTLKNAKNNKYIPNSVWPRELQLNDDKVKDNLQSALSKFADSFNSFVEIIRTKWLQIKKTPSDIGLIDFTLLQTEVDYLSTLIQPDMTLDAFLDQLLGYFFSDKLSPGLEMVRVALQNIAKPQIAKFLLELQSTVEQRVPSPDLWKLRTAIARARTNMQVALDRITEWFHLSQTESLNEPFLLQEAVDISAMSIQLACPDFKAQLNLSAELENLPIVGNLPSFIDLLFLAFENIVRHSEAGPQAIAEVKALLKDSVLSIRVENDVGVNTPSESTLQQISDLHSEMQTNVFSQSVKREGGTGFLKMQKILNHDFRAEDGTLPTLNFGFIEGKRFFVDIQVPRNFKQEVV